MSEAKGRVATMFFHEWLTLFQRLTDEEVGKIVMAILDFNANGNDTTFEDRAVDIVYQEIKNVVIRSRTKYDDTCRKKREYYEKRKSKKEESTIEDYSTVQNTIVDHSVEDNSNSNSNLNSNSKSNSSSSSNSNSNRNSNSNCSASPEEQLLQLLDSIIPLWNQNQCVQKIMSFANGSRRTNNTLECINTYGESKFFEVIKNIDNNAYFKDKSVKYDWFCEPANFGKIVEGNYEKDYSKKAIDWDSL